ncbi:DUF4806 domain-containing protein [Aphis craccivora]|uniref:DUF4806 domain-containing protein n=1 Tax=Aphis craccivora TaxID=307492 RepID=A0A6G0VQR9_APHCR|nr:DUF4806 domain-containing protein [Aphis craccivora]
MNPDIDDNCPVLLDSEDSGHSSIQKSHQYRLEKSPDNTFNDNSIDINTKFIFKNDKLSNSELHYLKNQRTVASNSPKKRFSTQQMLNSLPPDVCLRKLLANQVVMKIELKSINEQLKKITAYCLFPLESENDLINIENQIQSTPTYRKKLVKELSLSGGSKVKILLARILNKLFKDELLQNYSYFGRNKKKRHFPASQYAV